MNSNFVDNIKPELLEKRRPSKKVLDTASRVCRSSNVNLIKINRLRMSEVGLMMDQLDPKLKQDLKVVFLVRDPRGIYSSRVLRNFCKGNCRNAKEICKDMESNLNEYQQVKKKYPNQVHIVRHEDVSKNPFQFAKNFFPEVLNLTLNENVSNFIKSHTKKFEQQLRAHSTIRNSKNQTFVWTRRLGKKKIASFDHFCSSAMELAGYKSFKEGIMEGKNIEKINWTKVMKVI